MNMTPIGDWMTTQEAANLSGYHPDHVRRLIRAGLITARKWGNAWMISRESLLSYMVKVESEGARRGPKPDKE
jgi:excisionase family DNA binding protein